MGRGSGKGVATWPTQGTETELVPAGGRWDGPTGSFRGVWRASRSRPPRADRENTQPWALLTRRSRVGRCVTAAVTARWLCPASCLVVSEKPWARDLTREAVLRALWAHSDTSAPRSPGPLAPRVQSSPLLTLHGTAAAWNLPRSQCPRPTAMTGIVALTPATSCHSASSAACLWGEGRGDPDLGPRDSGPYRDVVVAVTQWLRPLLLLARPCDWLLLVPARSPRPHTCLCQLAPPPHGGRDALTAPPAVRASAPRRAPGSPPGPVR